MLTGGLAFFIGIMNEHPRAEDADTPSAATSMAMPGGRDLNYLDKAESAVALAETDREQGASGAHATDTTSPESTGASSVGGQDLEQLDEESKYALAGLDREQGESGARAASAEAGQRNPVGRERFQREPVGQMPASEELFLRIQSLGGSIRVESRGEDELVDLDVAKTAVVDSEIGLMVAIPNLRTLSMAHTRVTPNGFVHLRSMHSLRTLDLLGTGLESPDLMFVGGLESLRHLRISRTAIDDSGLRSLRNLSGHISLKARGTNITDNGLPHLSRLWSLKWLDIGETVVTDKGLRQLEGLRNLAQLRIDGTRVSDEGVAVLQRALPEVDIQWAGSQAAPIAIGQNDP
jgi:hypothetical protein